MLETGHMSDNLIKRIEGGGWGFSGKNKGTNTAKVFLWEKNTFLWETFWVPRGCCVTFCSHWESWMREYLSVCFFSDLSAKGDGCLSQKVINTEWGQHILYTSLNISYLFKILAERGALSRQPLSVWLEAMCFLEHSGKAERQSENPSKYSGITKNCYIDLPLNLDCT